VASFLRSIYTCDVDALPTECLAHRYWTKFGSDHSNSLDYVSCLRKRNLTLVACYNHTVQHCGRRFGEKTPARLAECNRLLWSDAHRAKYPELETRRHFEQYHLCSSELRRKVVDDRAFRRLKCFPLIALHLQMSMIQTGTSISPNCSSILYLIFDFCEARYGRQTDKLKLLHRVNVVFSIH